MANIKSSKKDISRSRVRAARNKARKHEIKKLTKQLNADIADGKVDEMQAVLKKVQSRIARAMGKGVIKKNTAARRISGLTRKVGAALASN